MRPSVFSGLFFAALLLAALPAHAVTAPDVCCKCRGPEQTSADTCLTVGFAKMPNSRDCASMPSVSESLKGWTCEPTPISQTQCKKAPAGICPSDPVSAFAAGQASEPAGSGSIFDRTPKPPAVIPSLNVPIPGLSFTAGDASSEQSSLLAQYIAASYRYLITIAATIATIMFVWGAFLYLIGSALPNIQRGKAIMLDAIVGLLLVLAANLILRTINPATLSLQALYIKGVAPVPYDDTEYLPRGLEGQTYRLPTGSQITLPKAICRSAECAAYCNGCSVKQPPPSAPWIPAPSSLTPVSLGGGLVSGNPKQVTTFLMRPEAAKALEEAGRIAASQGYTLRIAETYRPLENQLAGMCANLCGRSNKKLAAPGASLHGTGIAVDVSLFKGSQGLVYPVFPLGEQEKQLKRENVETLQRLMTQAGFVRYCPEVWHFEYGRAEGGEMRAACPWPPSSPK